MADNIYMLAYADYAVGAPKRSGPDGFSPEDNSQLYSLREVLINPLAHADVLPLCAFG